MLQKIRQVLILVTTASLIVSFICIIGGEDLSTSHLFILWGICIVSSILCAYLVDPRIIYRRIVPIGMCIAAIVYPLTSKFIPKHTAYGVASKKCYKIKKMAGDIVNCYLDIQSVYDEFSGYMQEESC